MTSTRVILEALRKAKRLLSIKRKSAPRELVAFCANVLECTEGHKERLEDIRRELDELTDAINAWRTAKRGAPKAMKVMIRAAQAAGASTALNVAQQRILMNIEHPDTLSRWLCSIEINDPKAVYDKLRELAFRTIVESPTALQLRGCTKKKIAAS